jgi:hypothetical protein
MKNIHVLPTDKPSRLQKFINYVVDKIEFELCSKAEFFNKGQHIYITDNSEIIEGDWCYHIELKDDKVDRCYQVTKYHTWTNNGVDKTRKFKKIILTTDPDLIADGVQAIDDEFLEWFVKNPSCEYVKITKDKIRQDKEFNDISHWNIYEYKIIIPQEEPKTNSCCGRCNGVDDICIFDREKPKQELHTCKYCGAETTQPDDECYAKPKQETVGKVFYESADKTITVYRQETVEEADELVDLCNKINFVNPRERVAYYNGLKNGAKWQAKQMYSEEEVYNIVEQAIKNYGKNQLGFFDGGVSNPIYYNLKQWFEQFKKK